MFRFIDIYYEKFITHFFLILTVCLIALYSVNAEGVHNETDALDDTDQKEVIQDKSLTQQGFEVHVDPDTGELISLPNEGANLVQPNNVIINNAPDEEAVMIENPDGSKTFYPPDSHQFTNKVKIDENGKLVTECGREHE